MEINCTSETPELRGNLTEILTEMLNGNKCLTEILNGNSTGNSVINLN